MKDRIRTVIASTGTVFGILLMNIGAICAWQLAPIPRGQWPDTYHASLFCEQAVGNLLLAVCAHNVKWQAATVTFGCCMFLLIMLSFAS